MTLNKSPAFTTALPLRRPQANSAAHAPAVAPRRVVHLAVSTPRTPRNPRQADGSRRGKRDPTFRKLQRRHRQGPAEFRRAREAAERGGGGEDRASSPGPSSRVVVAPRVRRPRFRDDGTPLSELAVGQRLAGVAQNTVPHGVYVDVGATVDGLVHVRDMAIDFVHEPDDLVRTGDRVTVWVKYVDAVANVLGLSMLRPARGGFDGRVAVSDLQVGARVRGVVHRITNFGAYVDVGAARPGFVHVTALWGRHPRDTLEGLRLGAELWVHVAHIDVARSHVTLKARGRGGDRLDEFCEVDDDPVAKTRGWLVDDEPGTVAPGSPLPSNTKIAVLRPGEELEEDVEEEEDAAAAELGDDASVAVEDEDEDDDDDEFAFAKAAQFGGVPLADVEESEEEPVSSTGDEFAFAEESTLMQEQGTSLGQLAGLIDDETELVGFEKGDEVLSYLRGKQERNKERELAELRGDLEDEDDEEDDDFVDEDEDDEDDDDVENEYDGVDEPDFDEPGRKDIRSLLHGDVDF